jgi:TonB family protein
MKPMPASPGSPRARFVGAGSLVGSILVHGLLVGAGALLVSARFGSRVPTAIPPAAEVAVDIAPLELPRLRMGAPFGEASEQVPNPEDRVDPGGGEPIARLDSHERGRGGSTRANGPAVNLADRNEGLTLSREITSRTDRDQIQRLDTSSDRASNEDRRSTTHPMDLVFLATGSGHLAERRPSSDFNPSRGATAAPPAAVLGSMVGASPIDPGEYEPDRTTGGRDPGALRASPGLGIMRGEVGRDHRSSAAVAMGRPLVTEGPPSVPSDQIGRPRDNVDSEQEVAATVQSIVHASTAGGLPGNGPGGEEGAGAPGSGGESGPGSTAAPFGGGSGPFTGLSDTDPRIANYRRSVLAKIYPLWENAFPKSASLEGKQGHAIISLVIYADGHVSSVQIARPSGVPEFDENVRTAVLRAAPFAPFPPNIPGPSMKWNITFDAKNPVVR